MIRVSDEIIETLTSIPETFNGLGPELHALIHQLAEEVKESRLRITELEKEWDEQQVYLNSLLDDDIARQ